MNRFGLAFFILVASVFSSCYERSAERSTNEVSENSLDTSSTDTIKVPFHTRINLYIENSGSMNGYVTGNTGFKNMLGDLLVNLKYEFGAQNIQLFFINDAIHPITLDRDITQFASTLNPARMRVGNTASSDLNLIFNKVLEKTEPVTLSILVSDLIYSIQGSNTEELLNYQKSQTKDAFLSKAKQGDELQTSLVQLTSNFNGIYWDKNNSKTILDNKTRPYYITVTGDADRVADFTNKIDLLKLKGYANRYTLTTDDFSENNYYSVLTSTYNQGRFKPIRSLSSSEYVRGIEDVEIDASRTGDENFTFALAIDLSRIPVEDAYKTDLKNYEVLAGNYTIDSVFAIKKKNIQPSDWIRIQSAEATHILWIKAKGKAFSDFSFALKKQIPAWVYKTDTEDDTDINKAMDKTFGFKYLVEGVSEAYEIVSDHKDYYFDIKIPVRKASASNTGKIFVVLLILAAFSGLLYTYLKRRK